MSLPPACTLPVLPGTYFWTAAARSSILRFRPEKTGEPEASGFENCSVNRRVTFSSIAVRLRFRSSFCWTSLPLSSRSFRFSSLMAFTSAVNVRIVSAGLSASGLCAGGCGTLVIGMCEGVGLLLLNRMPTTTTRMTRPKIGIRRFCRIIAMN